MFKKAVKSQSKLRCAIYGVAGSGKTYSALSIASGMGSKIALIDTEKGSASLYADKFSFDVCELEEKTIDTYIKVINAASSEYDVIIIDSLSHAWQELLEEVDKIAKTKYRGNSWSAWSEGTPKQKALIDAITSCKSHIICTMRAKTEWLVEKDNNNKSRITRAGLAPEQRSGMEYEFSLVLEINSEHLASVIKDRTGMFQDKIIDKPNAEFGKQLIEWLNTGEAAKPPRSEFTAQENKAIDSIIGRILATNNIKDLTPLYKEAHGYIHGLGIDKALVSETLNKVVALCTQRKGELSATVSNEDVQQ